MTYRGRRGTAPQTASASLSVVVSNHRQCLGLSQSRAARRMGLHPATLSRIEHGSRGMSLVMLARMAPVLGAAFVTDVLAVVRREHDAQGGDDDEG